MSDDKKISEYVLCVSVNENDPLPFDLENLSGDTVKKMRDIFNKTDYATFQEPCLYIANALIIYTEQEDRQEDNEFNLCHFICSSILKIVDGESPVGYSFALSDDGWSYNVEYKEKKYPYGLNRIQHEERMRYVNGEKKEEDNELTEEQSIEMSRKDKKISEYVKCVDYDNKHPIVLNNILYYNVKKMRQAFDCSRFYFFEELCLNVADSLFSFIDEKDKQNFDEITLCYYICNRIMDFTKLEKPVGHYFALKKEKGNYTLLHKKEEENDLTEEESVEISRKNLEGLLNMSPDDIDFIEVTDNTDDIGYFCIDRMDEALKGEARKIPSGLTREQTREFIIFSEEIPEDIEREELIEFLNNKIKESEIEEEKFDFDIEEIEQAKKEKLHTIPDFNSLEELDNWLNRIELEELYRMQKVEAPTGKIFKMNLPKKESFDEYDLSRYGKDNLSKQKGLIKLLETYGNNIGPIEITIYMHGNEADNIIVSVYYNNEHDNDCIENITFNGRYFERYVRPCIENDKWWKK